MFGASSKTESKAYLPRSLIDPIISKLLLTSLPTSKIKLSLEEWSSIQDFKVSEASSLHTVRNLYFLSKNSTLISRENCRFFWVNIRENVVVLDFLAVDNFDFTRKIVKKILVEKLVKMLGFCQN